MKNALATFVLGTAALAAQAQPSTYDWSYFGYSIGFTTSSYPPPVESTDWVPDTLVGGSFKGEDLNGDSMLTMNEISSFKFYTNSCSFDGGPAGGDCWIADFSYSLTSPNLKFRGALGGTQYQTLDLTKPARTRWGDPINAFSYLTPRSELSVTVAVPEPSTYLMLGTGLALLGLGLRRRRA